MLGSGIERKCKKLVKWGRTTGRVRKNIFTRETQTEEIDGEAQTKLAFPIPGPNEEPKDNVKLVPRQDPKVANQDSVLLAISELKTHIIEQQGAIDTINFILRSGNNTRFNGSEVLEDWRAVKQFINSPLPLALPTKCQTYFTI